MVNVAASVHQCRSVGLPVHDSRDSSSDLHPLFFPLNQHTFSWSERVGSWWHSLSRSRSDSLGRLGLWPRSVTAVAVSLAGPVHDSPGE
jgi:hypothetical protein